MVNLRPLAHCVPVQAYKTFGPLCLRHSCQDSLVFPPLVPLAQGFSLDSYSPPFVLPPHPLNEYQRVWYFSLSSLFSSVKFSISFRRVPSSFRPCSLTISFLFCRKGLSLLRPPTGSGDSCALFPILPWKPVLHFGHQF